MRASDQKKRWAKGARGNSEKRAKEEEKRTERGSKMISQMGVEARSLVVVTHMLLILAMPIPRITFPD